MSDSDSLDCTKKTSITPQVSLSPVLSTSKQSRKCFKNRKHIYKELCKSKNLKTESYDNIQQNESICNINKKSGNTKMNENVSIIEEIILKDEVSDTEEAIIGAKLSELDIMSRIKKLEDAERSRNEITALLSFNDSLSKINNSPDDPYVIKCPVSGGHLKLSNQVETGDNKFHKNETYSADNEVDASKTVLPLTSLENKPKIPRFGNCSKTSAIDVFTGENFADLNNMNFSGFKRASDNMKFTTSTNDSKIDHSQPKYLKMLPLEAESSHKMIENLPGQFGTNIFKGENFSDLKKINFGGFKSASENLKSATAITGSTTLTTNIPLIDDELVKNIFKEDETLDDPYTTKPFKGFQSTNFIKAKEINQTITHNIQLHESSNNQLDKRTDNRGNCTGRENIESFVNVFQGENFDDLKCDNFSSFQKASDNLQIKDCNLHNSMTEVVDSSENMSVNVINQLNKEKREKKNLLTNDVFFGLNSVNSGSETTLVENNMDSKSVANFSSINKTKGFKSLFESENFADLNFSDIHLKCPLPTPGKLTNFQKLFESPLILKTNNDQPAENFYGFNQREKNENQNVSTNIFNMIKILENRVPGLEKTIVNPSYKHSSVNVDTPNTVMCESIRNYKKRKFSETESNDVTENQKCAPTEESSFLKRPKKRLGCQYTPTIKVSETSLKNAMNLFGDLQYESNRNTSTPIKTNHNAIKSIECDITPIQRRQNLYKTHSNSNTNTKILIQHSKSWSSAVDSHNKRCCFKKPTEGDINWWIDNLAHEKRLLEEKLYRFNEQQLILETQEKLLKSYKINNCSSSSSEIIPGILYHSKQNHQIRFPLKNLSGDAIFEQNSFIWQINPQNSHLVHFFVDIDKQAFIQTSDGAKIVPNQQGKIGISEIEYSFKTMKGVNPNLLPNGWIKNHFRWIVWKLASYERMFDNHLKGCLNLENVIQQLKYRYDVEIDNAKRSALRRIFENDDCSKKRIVLCVSKIVKTNTTYELELTDGWYAIKAMIDNPLSEQIVKEKIYIGVKLMICGAEFINSTGCHPLELESAVSYLKIYYNSTRRCLWWTKLGYQKHSIPYLIPMSSINLDGGTIGRIKIYILRVYPLKYFEKCHNRNVWRNKKAAERHAQELENEKIKELERIENLFLEGNNASGSKNRKCDSFKMSRSIKDIDDPEVLYEIMQEENDEIMEDLSSDQLSSLNQYIIQKSNKEKSKYLDTLKEKSRILDKKSAVPLLKLKLIDYEETSKEIYDFYIWHPQDCHLQELCENEIFALFNVSCSPKWGLGVNRYTHFKKEPYQCTKKFETLIRKNIPIKDMYNFSYFSPHFKEFDTVGIAIKKDIAQYQKLWMADTDGTLLVINILDTPKNILLLDVVEEGEIISMCNLIYKQSFHNYIFAIADHCTICSKYPHNKHLKEALKCFEDKFKAKDLNRFITNCKEAIKKIEEKPGDNSKAEFNENDDMDCSQITTTDLVLLECIDKLT